MVLRGPAELIEGYSVKGFIVEDVGVLRLR